ncbi:hypothetical protein [Marinicella sp. W31]|uniref:hypothetical protein n=1 Tax=Marinicella sp. W31 TaxID=3023713 RepID=UPI00375742B7
MIFLEDKEKNIPTPKIGKCLKAGVFITAFTVSIMTPVTSFSQDSGCDTDSDCITVIGDPDSGGGGIHIFPPTGGGSGGGSGGSSGGGGSGSGSSPGQCLYFENLRPDDCFSDPGNAMNLNYWNFTMSNFQEINPEIPGTGHRIFEYLNVVLANNVIHNLARTFFNTGDYANARSTIWNQLASHCTNSFSQSNQNDCLKEQAEFFMTIRPSNTSTGNWTAGLNYGFTLITYTPLNHNENWVQRLLGDVTKKKKCHIWYQDDLFDACY